MAKHPNILFYNQKKPFTGSKQKTCNEAIFLLNSSFNMGLLVYGAFFRRAFFTEPTRLAAFSDCFSNLDVNHFSIQSIVISGILEKKTE